MNIVGCRPVTKVLGVMIDSTILPGGVFKELSLRRSPILNHSICLNCGLVIPQVLGRFDYNYSKRPRTSYGGISVYSIISQYQTLYVKIWGTIRQFALLKFINRLACTVHDVFGKFY